MKYLFWISFATHYRFEFINCCSIAGKFTNRRSSCNYYFGKSLRPALATIKQASVEILEGILSSLPVPMSIGFIATEINLYAYLQNVAETPQLFDGDISNCNSTVPYCRILMFVVHTFGSHWSILFNCLRDKVLCSKSTKGFFHICLQNVSDRFQSVANVADWF